jgi:3-oxoacyl-[acyl-carrier protein] reductase
MNLELENKLALVTASSGGIGKKLQNRWLERRDRSRQARRTAASVDAALADIRRRVPDAKLERLAADNGTAAGTEETIRVSAGGDPHQ